MRWGRRREARRTRRPSPLRPPAGPGDRRGDAVLDFPPSALEAVQSGDPLRQPVKSEVDPNGHCHVNIGRAAWNQSHDVAPIMRRAERSCPAARY